MTTTRSAECNAPGTPLMLAFDLGSTKWTLGFTTAPAQRPRIRTMPAGDLVTLVKEVQLAKARFRLPLSAPVRAAARDDAVHLAVEARAVPNSAPCPICPAS